MRAARTLGQEGRAVVIVLHDLSLSSAYADRIALLSDGRIEALGTPSEVLTAEQVSRVYGVPVRIVHPTAGARPIVLPLRDLE